MALIEKLTNIANGFRSSRSLTQKLSLDEMAVLAAVPLPEPDNKLNLYFKQQLHTITAEDLEGVSKLQSHALYQSGCVSIIMSDTISEIGVWCFSGSPDLSHVILSSTLASIPNYAFADCSSLSYLSIPMSVSSIGSYALWCGNEDEKATFRFNSTTPPSITSSTFLPALLSQIIVPAGCGEVYKSATNWANFADYIVEESV